MTPENVTTASSRRQTVKATKEVYQQLKKLIAAHEDASDDLLLMLATSNGLKASRGRALEVGHIRQARVYHVEGREPYTPAGHAGRVSVPAFADRKKSLPLKFSTGPGVFVASAVTKTSNNSLAFIVAAVAERAQKDSSIDLRSVLLELLK